MNLAPSLQDTLKYNSGYNANPFSTLPGMKFGTGGFEPLAVNINGVHIEAHGVDNPALAASQMGRDFYKDVQTIPIGYSTSSTMVG